MKAFEDLRTGEVIELGAVTVSEEEIIAFARDYDPQPFHVDPIAAQETHYGGLIASGWQTCALFTRLWATRFLNATRNLGSPGVDELRWPAPVRPGDTLSATLEIVETRPSRSRPDRGIVRVRGTLRNASGEPVLTLLATQLIGRREVGARDPESETRAP